MLQLFLLLHEQCTFAKIIMQKYKLYTHLGKYNLQMFSEWKILFLIMYKWIGNSHYCTAGIKKNDGIEQSYVRMKALNRAVLQ